MRGFPKNLNTKFDYEYVKENFPAELWVPEFQALLDSARDWFFVREVASEAAGITDATHKVIENTVTTGINETTGEPITTITYAQYEFKTNPTAKIFRIGYTENEVKAIIASAKV